MTITAVRTGLTPMKHPEDIKPVVVETLVSAGLPGFQVVNLTDGACRELRDRVRAAFMCSEFSWPQQKVTINVAPFGGLPVYRRGLDLAVAVGILAATGQADVRPDLAVPPAELTLDGHVRRLDHRILRDSTLRDYLTVCRPWKVGDRIKVTNHIAGWFRGVVLELDAANGVPKLLDDDAYGHVALHEPVIRTIELDEVSE